MNLEKLRAMDQRINPELYSQNAIPETQSSFASMQMPMSMPIPIKSPSPKMERPPSPYKSPDLKIGSCYEIFENNVSGIPASQGIFKFKGEVGNELQFICVNNSCADGASKYGEDYYYSKTLVKSSIGGKDQYEFTIVDCPPDRKCVKTKNKGMSCTISGGRKRKKTKYQKTKQKRIQTKKKFRKSRNSNRNK